MTILIVITKAEIGGAQMSVLNLAKGLKEDGYNVIVGFGDGDFLSQELKKQSIEIKRFKWLKRTHNLLANFYFIFEINKYLKEKRDIKVVHFNSSNSLFGALGVKAVFRKIKTVFTFRGMSVLDNNYKMNKLLRLAYFLFFKFFLLFIDSPVFVSKRNVEDARKSGLSNKGVVVYNGLGYDSLNFLERQEARNQFKDKFNIDLADKYVLGTIGRLCYAKNYEFLINSFNDILKVKSNAVLLIVGEGEERVKYEKLIKKNNLSNRVFLIGSIKNASKLIKAFDLFVLPSRYEGLSITLIEALFSGVPALVSDVGGNSENFPSDYELYELDNKKEFLEKFQRLQYEEVVKEIDEINKKQRKVFDIKNTVKSYKKIYD